MPKAKLSSYTAACCCFKCCASCPCEYQFDCASYNDVVEPFSLPLFLEIWRTVFAYYVKIRKFKQCCRKCNLCSYLFELRRKFTDARDRKEVARLFEVYRMTYMGEREAFGDAGALELFVHNHRWHATGSVSATHVWS